MNTPVIADRDINMFITTEFNKTATMVELYINETTLLIEFRMKINEKASAIFSLVDHVLNGVTTSIYFYDNDENRIENVELDATTEKEGLEFLNWFKDNYKTLI